MADVEADDVGILELFSDSEGPVGEAMEALAYVVQGEAAREILAGDPQGWLYTTYFFRGREGRPLGGLGFMQTPGKLYMIGDRPPHRASAPGQPPASDTGNLAAQLGHEMGHDPDGVINEDIYDDAAYSLYLELGTTEMEPRPYLRPALDILKITDVGTFG